MSKARKKEIRDAVKRAIAQVLNTLKISKSAKKTEKLVEKVSKTLGRWAKSSAKKMPATKIVARKTKRSSRRARAQSK